MLNLIAWENHVYFYFLKYVALTNFSISPVSYKYLL